MGRSGDTKSFKNFSGACFEGIAVRLNDQILEFGISVPVEVVLGRRQDLFFLGHGCPESPISHHDDVDDPLVFILKVVLFKDAEHGTLGDREFSVADALLSGQHLEQGRFSAAVRSHDPVAFASVELKRHVFEEDAVPIVFGEVRERDHVLFVGEPWWELAMAGGLVGGSGVPMGRLPYQRLGDSSNLEQLRPERHLHGWGSALPPPQTDNVDWFL